jgi:type VI secretion system protein ImpH
MATYGWRTDRSVAEWLLAEGYRFDFYRVVTLLERLDPDRESVGEGNEPTQEAVRFTSKVNFAFPASDVAEVSRQQSAGRTADVVVNFLGLAGGFGPMPVPYTEVLLERLWNRDAVLRDFLDIFNHRLVSLMYQVRKRHRVGIDFTSPAQTPLARYLFALMGLGTPGLQARLQTPDRTWLSYAGLVAQQPRTMAGLERLLTDYFRIPVKGQPFCGQWYPLDADQVTAIGASGQNQRLGHGVVLGRRVWDQQGSFELHVGPLTWVYFEDFLPIGGVYRSLCELTRFYVGPELGFDVRLTLQAAEVPAARLSAESGPRLGWTSWLKTRDFTEDDSQVKLTSKSSV